MKTLHLNLKKKWFDMIKSGEKTEEYREIKDHYIPLLFDFKKSDSPYHKSAGEVFSYYHGFLGARPKAINHLLRKKYVAFKKIDTITFSNGYQRDRNQFVIELKGIKINSGWKKWGAEPFKSYFVFKLGEINYCAPCPHKTKPCDSRQVDCPNAVKPTKE